MNKTYLHLPVIVIVGLLAYSGSFSVPFQFDDLFNIVQNPVIKDLGNFTSSLAGYQYNPRRFLGYFSLALNYRYGGLDVVGYHIVNLLIHLINAVLVYFFVILTFKTPYFVEAGNGQGAMGKGQGDRQGGMGKGQWGKPDLPLSPIANSLSPSSPPVTSPQSQVPEVVALFSALLFVSHPVQTQAVTYIVQRFTSLAALFYLLAVVMYIKGRLWATGEGQMEKSTGQVQAFLPLASRRMPIAYFFFSLIFAVCAMKTKEIAFTLPLMILLYEFTFFRSTLKRKLLFLAPVLLTLAIIPLSMLHIDRPLGEVLSDLSEKARLQTDMSRGDYLMTELRVIVTYIRLIFLPVNQDLDYAYPVYHSFFSPPVFLSFLFLAALFGTAVYLLYRSRQGARGNRRWEKNEGQEARGNRQMEETGRWENTERQVAMGDGQVVPLTSNLSPMAYRLSPIAYYRLVAFGILWFFLALSVESSFIPIVDVIFEHRLYLPSIGAFIALTAALFGAALKMEKRWPQSERAVISLLIISVVALSSATFARNRVWRDEAGLWEDVVRKSPGNARPHNDLGYIYYTKGMNDRAIEQFLYALRLRPDYLDARINLGIAYNAKGMFDQAIEQFLTALRMAPDDPDAHNNLGISYVSKGLIDEGIKHYQRAISLKPDYYEAYNNLGVACVYRGLREQAKENFEHAISLKPDYYEAYHNLALLYEKMGEPEKAAAIRSKARQMKPGS